MAAVLVERARPGIDLVTLHRPEALNALTPDAMRELDQVLQRITDDASCRAVVLTGAGRGFCAGLDLGDIEEVSGGTGVTELLERQRSAAALIERLRSVPHPVIAAVNGAAAGAGLALALASDTRVCAQAARFNAAFVRLGLSGCDLGVTLLPQVVGPTLAFEMMLTGRLIDADEAAASGLVVRVTADDSVVAAALDIAGRVSANSPFGVRMTKEVMWANLDAPSLRVAIELENRTQVLCACTEDQAEAVAAFVERRPPVFTGR